MCGIFGFYLNRPIDESDIRKGNEALRQLRHRGPDNSGWWADRESGVFLGHTRLAIIDLSEESNQPFQEGDSVLTYNGEIYNYKELREQLRAAGEAPHTQGDTEVLLRAWRRWGTQALERLDGMYAFALYSKGVLHLATDAFGEKPLYWVHNAEGFYFSSEPQPLVAFLNLRPAWDEETVATFMSLGFLQPEHTGFVGLRRCLPATYIRVAPQQWLMRQYWEPPEPALHRGKIRPLDENAIDAILDALIQSLKVRTHADVPLGLFLSGGVDSALIAALVAKELRQPLLTLTVSFPDGTDESLRAAQIAAALDLPHTVIDSREDPYHATPDNLLDLYGELNDNLTAFPVRMLSKLARKHMTAALTGLGGDELFFGYGRYQRAWQLRHLWSLPLSWRQSLAVGARRVTPWAKAARLLEQLGAASESRRLIALRNYPAADWLDQLPGIETISEKLFFNPYLDVTSALRFFDSVITLPQSYIPAMERASMRASLEVRTPYLNRNLWEVVARTDQRALVAFQHKHAVRRMLRRYLPEKLFNHPKQGFVFPHRRFLRGLPARTPECPGIDPAGIQAVWKRRELPGWQNIAVRLILLEAFTRTRERHATGTYAAA